MNPVKTLAQVHLNFLKRAKTLQELGIYVFGSLPAV